MTELNVQTAAALLAQAEVPEGAMNSYEALPAAEMEAAAAQAGMNREQFVEYIPLILELARALANFIRNRG